VRPKIALIIIVCVTGCLNSIHKEAPSIAPMEPPDTVLCGSMCQHLGPNGLNCEEGMSVYDSDKPGPKDEPNTSCEEFCKTSQMRGYFLNPRCLILVPSCNRIEEFRKKDPNFCK
jgi:hypothetical protein